MIKLLWDERFIRTSSKLLKNDETLKSKFREKIKLFETDPFNPTLKTHKLSGKLDGYWAFRID